MDSNFGEINFASILDIKASLGGHKVNLNELEED